MEVHHHSHSADPGIHRGRKKWTHYFWEFLMLFLAVFCGFLAENYREHKIEQHRAKEYAVLLIGDLKNDTLQILRAARQLKEVAASIDSISSFVFIGITGNKVNGSFYYHSQIGAISPQIVWNDATLIQLTQSGNLRYFRNHELVNKISSYYARQDYVRNLNSSDRDRREKTVEMRSRVLNNHFYKNYSSALTLDTLSWPDSLMKAMIPLQNNEISLLNEYANSFENRRGYINLVLNDTFPKILERARELILLLKKEYRLI
jgi:hypothetical protein